MKKSVLSIFVLSLMSIYLVTRECPELTGTYLCENTESGVSYETKVTHNKEDRATVSYNMIETYFSELSEQLNKTLTIPIDEPIAVDAITRIVDGYTMIGNTGSKDTGRPEFISKSMFSCRI